MSETFLSKGLWWLQLTLNSSVLILQSRKSSKTNSWTLVGGVVEEGETLIQAAIREVVEEIASGFVISEKDLELTMSFEETAASDPSKRMNMNIFLSNKNIDVELKTSEEILEFYWYSIGDEHKVSNSIKDHLLPMLIEKGLMKEGKSNE